MIKRNFLTIVILSISFFNFNMIGLARGDDFYKSDSFKTTHIKVPYTPIDNFVRYTKIKDNPKLKEDLSPTVNYALSKSELIEQEQTSRSPKSNLISKTIDIIMYRVFPVLIAIGLTVSIAKGQFPSSN